tara:strand:+ start:451 stop:1041 length:591 start_codon:yes stop_codon:yes gene_type:complete
MLRKQKGVKQKGGKRMLFDGERHAPIYTKDGFKRATYEGPGTQIIKRLLSTDPDIHEPISMTDKTSMAHDIRYSLGKSKQDIRKADEKMIDVINQKKDEDYWINRKVASIPIKAKMKMENMGLDTSKIASFGAYEGEHKPLLENTLEKLEQEGYGKKEKTKTGKSSKWIDHLKAYQKDNNCSYKEAMKLAKATYVK